MYNAQQDIYTNLCIGSLGRAPSPISLRFVNGSCLCLAVSAARCALSPSRSRVRSSLFSLSCNGFRAVLEVFVFTTSSKTNIKSDYKSMRTCSQLDHAHSVRTWRMYTRCTTYDTYMCIYIFRRSQLNSYCLCASYLGGN